MTPTDSILVQLGAVLGPLLAIAGSVALSVLPAWGLASRLNVDPLTRLLVSATVSYILLYVLQAGAYVFGAPPWLPWTLGVAICGITLADTLWRRRQGIPAQISWPGLLTWTALALWIFALESRLVVYGLPEYGEDWYEHYHRSIFFLEHLPVQTRFLGFWTLAARGPAYNTAAAFFLNLFRSEGFWAYQTVAVVLSTFCLLPFALLLRDRAGLRERKALLCAAIILGLAPAFVLDEIPVTKILATGLTLAAIYFYLRGLAARWPWMTGFSVVTWALAFLTHFFTLPYAMFFGAHWLFTAVRRRWGWRAVLWPLACGALLVGFWLGFLVHTFGVAGTLTANTTLGSAYAEAMYGPEGPPPRYRVAISNSINSLVPCELRHALPLEGTPLDCPRVLQTDLRPGEANLLEEMGPASDWRYAMVTHTFGFPGALSLAGCVLLLLFVVRGLRTNRADPYAGEPGLVFWALFVFVGVPLNVAAKTEESIYGTLLLNLQPYLWLAAILVVAQWRRLRPWLRNALLVLFLVEGGLATTAYVSLGQRPVPAELRQDGHLVGTGEGAFNYAHLANYRWKLQMRATFLSDRYASLPVAMSTIGGGLALGLLGAGWVVARRRRPDGDDGIAAPPPH